MRNLKIHHQKICFQNGVIKYTTGEGTDPYFYFWMNCRSWNVKFFIVLFFLHLSTVSSSPAQTYSTRQLDFIIEPYLQQLNDTSFKILWETSVPAKGFVRLGIVDFNVLKPNFNKLFHEKKISNYHNVLANELKTGEKYFYQVFAVAENSDTLFGPITPITIPDYTKMPVSFAVIGDTQLEHAKEIWGSLSELIFQERPSFVVHVGDLVRSGLSKNEWVDDFFKPARNLLRFYPLYPTLGNHEKNSKWYYQYFDLPDPEWFYTIKKGNVLFIFADTNRDILPGSEQYRKLEKVLASSQDKWKIIVQHHPVYVSEEGFYGNTWFQKAVHGDPNDMHLKKLYEMYGVDLVLNGHAHFYERTWPVANDRIDTQNGVTYITTGGGNSDFSKFAVNKSWYDARTRAVNHFLYINIVDNTLYGQAIDSTGNIFDNWKIEKLGQKKLNVPSVFAKKQYFIDSTTIVIQNPNSSGEINFSLNSEAYKTGMKKEIRIFESTNVTVFINDGPNQSLNAKKTFEKLPMLKSIKKGKRNVEATYYEGDWIALPDFTREKALRSFSLDSVTLTEIKPRRKDHFAVRFTGSFQIPETNVYRFLMESFDGSKLFIDGKEIISNDGIHYEIRKENYIALEKGIHNFEVQYFDFVRRETLKILIGSENKKMDSFNQYMRIKS